MAAIGRKQQCESSDDGNQMEYIFHFSKIVSLSIINPPWRANPRKEKKTALLRTVQLSKFLHIAPIEDVKSVRVCP